MYRFPISRAIIRRIGHRGAFLLFLALLDILYGVSLHAVPGPLATYNLGLSTYTWANIWIIVGVFLLWGAFCIRDKFHYATAASIKAFWAVAITDAWLTQGFVRGWVSGVIWAAFACLVLVISSWPESRNCKLPRQDGHKPDG